MNKEIDDISLKIAGTDKATQVKIFEQNPTPIVRLFVVWAVSKDRKEGLPKSILHRAAKVKEKGVSGDWWTSVCDDFNAFVKGLKEMYGWMDRFQPSQGGKKRADNSIEENASARSAAAIYELESDEDNEDEPNPAVVNKDDAAVKTGPKRKQLHTTQTPNKRRQTGSGFGFAAPKDPADSIVQ